MQHFNLFTVFCLTVILGILPTIPCVRSVFRSFAKPLAVGLVLTISACGGGGGGTAATSPSGNMPGDEMSPMTIPLPTPSSARTLADLNAYDMPTALAADEIRAGGDAASVGDITGFRYNDADGNQRVLVQKLDFAHLGIWINGPAFTNNFNYANLDQNVVTPPSRDDRLGTAIYAIEAEAVYNGIRFFPDGELTVRFDSNRWEGFISANASDAADDFGSLRQVSDNDQIRITIINGVIDESGFHSPTGFAVTPSANGIFRNFRISGALGSTFRGRFSDDTSSYDASTAPPRELSGIFGGAVDSNGNELRGGFLGQCVTNC